MNPELKSTHYGTGLISRQREPVNLESPFDQLESFLTPNEIFYIRSHFKAPALDGTAHTLRIGGEVKNAFVMGLKELRQMPAKTIPATLECAGNGRVYLTPAVEGAQWELGAVGTAEWTGVPLSDLLERAQLNERVCELVFEGADRGKPAITPLPPGDIAYARSVPLAEKDKVLIAYLMNGEELTVDHGYPLRAIVPGHYGMASVKWLTNILAVSMPFQGYWQTVDYGYWAEENGLPVRRPLDRLSLKSSIARPRVREVVKAGGTYTVFGAAWSGDSDVSQVDVTVDGGASWAPAELLDAAQPGAWRRWKYEWQVPTKPGCHCLMSRARNAAGQTQPAEHDHRFGTYIINHIIPVEVLVK